MPGSPLTSLSVRGIQPWTVGGACLVTRLLTRRKKSGRYVLLAARPIPGIAQGIGSCMTTTCAPHIRAPLLSAASLRRSARTLGANARMERSRSMLTRAALLASALPKIAAGSLRDAQNGLDHVPVQELLGGRSRSRTLLITCALAIHAQKMNAAKKRPHVAHSRIRAVLGHAVRMQLAVLAHAIAHSATLDAAACEAAGPSFRERDT